MCCVGWNKANDRLFIIEEKGQRAKKVLVEFVLADGTVGLCCPRERWRRWTEKSEGLQVERKCLLL